MSEVVHEVPSIYSGMVDGRLLFGAVYPEDVPSDRAQAIGGILAAHSELFIETSEPLKWSIGLAKLDGLDGISPQEQHRIAAALLSQDLGDKGIRLHEFEPMSSDDLARTIGDAALNIHTMLSRAVYLRHKKQVAAAVTGSALANLVLA